jgi:protein tyrosine phosphatase (PTP) superfamily phosphohydrolase (DUF442 family)
MATPRYWKVRIAAALLALLCVAPFSAAQAPSVVAPPQSGIAPAKVSAPAEKLNLAGLGNAGRINDVLYRGAQPSAQGLTALKNLGITTIVDLRGEASEVQWERTQAESLGLRFVSMPLSGWAPPSDRQVAQFLELFRDAPQEKFFVHCRYGADRTGVLVAAYRISQQSWTVEQAISEMHSFGFHFHWHPSMQTYVRKFPASLAQDSTFASLRTPVIEAKRP